MELLTPLYEQHVSLGAKMVPFAGYLMPIQYPTGVIAEHMATRQQAGLFDVSHMGEIMIEGAHALASLNDLLTNDFSQMVDGQVKYALMCNERGGVVDDLLVYKFHAAKFLLVVNASNKDTDVAWVNAHIPTGVTDVSDQFAQLALQGPASKQIAEALLSGGTLPEKYYSFAPEVSLAGIACNVSRTGYTGEYGYEILCAPEDAKALWAAMLAAGEEFGILPCGLGARDTLRLEAGMPLYGHELSADISPLEANLDFAVKLDKPHFIGQAALQSQPVRRVRVGLQMTGRGIAREQMSVYSGDVCIGETTSGTHCPFLAQAVAMAYLDKDAATIGQTVQVDIRGRKTEATIVPYVFYKRTKS